MKNIIKSIFKILIVTAGCLMFASFSPSLDGRAVVVDNGVFPQGLFAKTVGYLPGDIISVTNIAGDSTVDLLVIGALDPSEGVAIMLSPEAAQAMGIEKGSNNIVKITKRSGQDERVYGSAVISKSSAELDDWDDGSLDSITDEENTDAFEEAEAPEELEVPEDFEAEEEAETDYTEPEEDLEEEAFDEESVEEEAFDEEAFDEESVEEEAFDEEAPAEEEIEADVEEEPEEGLPAEAEETEPEAFEEDVDEEEYSEETPDALEDEPEEEAFEEEALDELPVEEEPAEEAEDAIEEENVEEEAEDPETEELEAEETEEDEEIPAEEEFDEEAVEEETPEELPVEETAEETEETQEEEEDDTAEEALVEDELEALPEEDKVDVPETEEFDEDAAEAGESEEYEAIVLVPVDSNPPEAESDEVEDVITDTELDSVEEISEVEEVEENEAPAPVVEAEKRSTGSYDKYVVPSLKDLESGKYYIQIAVYASDDNILEVINKYGNNYPITIVPMAGGVSKQILIGPVTMDEYKVVLERFKSYGFKDAFLRKVR